MTIDYDPDLEDLCIGECYQPTMPHTKVYWAKWALELMAEGFTLQAPAVHYSRSGDLIYRHNVRKDTHHIYELKDVYDDLGRRLGVWPD
jgi:hypothetical protein